MVDQKHLHLTAVAMERSLLFDQPQVPEALIQRIEILFKDVTIALKQEGCCFIGHIKALLDAGDVGQIFFSVTRFNQRPRRKGILEGDIVKGHLTINVIVPEVSQERAEKITLDALNRQFHSDISP